jgi:hypothetical protein
LNQFNNTNNNNPNKNDLTSTNLSSTLIGYCQISFFKDNYCYLSEYLFHSVYDSKSLECFDLKQYLFNNFIINDNNNNNNSIDSNESLDKINNNNKSNDNINSNRNNNIRKDLSLLINDYKYNTSPFLKHYLNYESVHRNNKLISFNQLDDRLTKAFKLIQLPFDWTILGQNCYLNIGTYFILIYYLIVSFICLI